MENWLKIEKIATFYLKMFVSLSSTCKIVRKGKVGQHYLIKPSRKKKNTDWNIQKILIFAVENKGHRANSNLVPSTLHLVTALLVPGLLNNYIVDIVAQT